MLTNRSRRHTTIKACARLTFTGTWARNIFLSVSTTLKVMDPTTIRTMRTVSSSLVTLDWAADATNTILRSKCTPRNTTGNTALACTSGKRTKSTGHTRYVFVFRSRSANVKVLFSVYLFSHVR